MFVNTRVTGVVVVGYKVRSTGLRLVGQGQSVDGDGQMRVEARRTQTLKR
jgi:hypothetical protein